MLMDLLSQCYDLLLVGIDMLLHLDVHLNALMQYMGPWTYLVLFLIIFAETGLVVVPFLPGDSLLFATGALAALDGSPLNLGVLTLLLLVAAIIGDAVNYRIGHRLGPKIFHSETSWLLNRQHLLYTQQFYEAHGGKTVVIARFMPIVRTFAPFVAGVGRMDYKRFSAYNVSGAILWVVSFLYAGYYFGNMPVVKTNFHIIIVAIIVISVVPSVVGFLRSRQQAKATAKTAS